jgi:hypothetical protein
MLSLHGQQLMHSSRTLCTPRQNYSSNDDDHYYLTDLLSPDDQGVLRDCVINTNKRTNIHGELSEGPI